MEHKVDVGVLEYRVQLIEDAVKGINASLAVLTRLEQRHSETSAGLARAFRSIEDQHNRIEALEREQPLTRLALRLIIGTVVGAASMLAAAGAALILHH